MKQGDRVQLKTSRYLWIKLPSRHTGTILRDPELGETLQVAWDGWDGGHNADGRIPSNNAWYVESEDVEVINESQPSSAPKPDEAGIAQLQNSVQELPAAPRRGTPDRKHKADRL